MASVPDDLAQRLDKPILARTEDGFLQSNFDIELLKYFYRIYLFTVSRLFSEIYYWKQLNKDIPDPAVPLYEQREPLRILRENVLLLVRGIVCALFLLNPKDYNKVIRSLSPEERKLFEERIVTVDSKIHPGLGKHMWSGSGVDSYLKKTRAFVLNVMKVFFQIRNQLKTFADDFRIQEQL